MSDYTVDLVSDFWEGNDMDYMEEMYVVFGDSDDEEDKMFMKIGGFNLVLIGRSILSNYIMNIFLENYTECLFFVGRNWDVY